MSDQNPDMGSFDGLAGSPPSGGGKLFGVDFNAPPSEVLGIDFRSRHEQLFDKKPAYALDSVWNQLNNAKMESDAQESRLHDQNAMDTIERDQQENQKHMDFLSQRIAEIDKNLAMPIPLRHMAQLGPTDDIALALAYLLSGGKGNVLPTAITAATGNAQRQQDITDQNAQAQYETKRQDLLRQLQSLDQEARETESYGQRLEESRIAERRHQSDLVVSEKDKEESRKIQSDREAVTDRQEKFREIDAQYKNFLHEIDMMGGVQPERAKEMQSTLDTLIAQGKTMGVDYTAPPIPNGPTWKAQHEQFAEAHANQVLEEKRKEFQANFKMKLSAFQEKIVHDRAQEDYWKSVVVTSQGRLGVEQYNAYHGKNEKEIQKRTDALENAKTEAVNSGYSLVRNKAGQLTVGGKPPSGSSAQKSAEMRRRNALQTKIQNAEREVNEARQVQGDAGGIDKSGGVDALGSDEVRTLADGRKVKRIGPNRWQVIGKS